MNRTRRDLLRFCLSHPYRAITGMWLGLIEAAELWDFECQLAEIARAADVGRASRTNGEPIDAILVELGRGQRGRNPRDMN